MLGTNAKVSRLRKVQSGVDAYGDPVFTEIEEQLPRALFAPGGTVEPRASGREPVVSEPTLYWRGQSPDVLSSDRLVVGGTIFEVQGEPAKWVGSRAGGLAVTLRVAEEGAA